MRRVARRCAWMVAAACMALALASCAVSVTGTPVPGGRGGPGSETVDPDAYDVTPDGSGFARGEVDQPMPVPGFNWVGWAKQPADRCAWVPPGLFDGFAADAPKAVGHFCSFVTTEGNNIQVTWGATYGPFLYDPVAFMEPAQIAGLEARVYDLAASQKVYPGSCHAQVDTRSLSGLQVLQWNAQKRPMDRAQSCATVKKIAEKIARTMVPLAGGTVWPVTPQKPDPSQVGLKACAVVDDIVTTYAGIEIKDENHEEGTSDAGATCTAERKGTRATALLTPGPDLGLAQVPPASDARVVGTTIGPLPARKEVLATSCAVAVEFTPGRLLRIEYSKDTGARAGCLFAREMVIVAVGRMIQKVG